MSEISVIINTRNEEKNVVDVISSAKKIADEIVVVDMKSSDNTVKLAKKEGVKVYSHEYKEYVEPARNFAISKATKEWILIIDPDELLTPGLIKKFKQIVKKPNGDYFRIPRKNIIFGKWIKHSRWWPDYKIRFFKKGSVSWGDEIHSIPITQGVGVDLLEKESLAIIHNHYQSVEQYLERMNRYTSIQAKEKIDAGYKFIWKDLIGKPSSEFLSRYFAGEGYKDGLHGLALSLLQAFSESVMYIKIWQEEKFLEQAITPKESVIEMTRLVDEFDWWLTDVTIKNQGLIKSLPRRIRRKIKTKK